MKIRPRFLLYVLVLLLIGAPFTAAQWDKKPSSKWSERESQKLLNDSPWAQTQTFSDLSQMTGNSALPAGGTAGGIHYKLNLRFKVTDMSI